MLHVEHAIISPLTIHFLSSIVKHYLIVLLLSTILLELFSCAGVLISCIYIELRSSGCAPLIHI